MLRFGLGLGAVFGVGLVAFRSAVFVPDSPAFGCLAAGAAAAAILALLRSDRLHQALAVAAACVVVRLGFLESQGWAPVAAGAFRVAGMVVACLIFDALARVGIRVGKFLVLGALLGGLYVALVPLAELGRLVASDLPATLFRHAMQGVIVGDAVGFGIEVADWALRARQPRLVAQP